MRDLGRWMLAQAAASVGVCCVALHVVTALAPGHGDAWVRALLVLMATGCLPCVRGLWRSPTRRVWASTGVMYTAMLGGHLLVAAPWSPETSPHHHLAAGTSWMDVGMWGGVVLAVVQLLLVATALAGRLAVPGPSVRPAPAQA
jgi:hypothetical protein